MGGKQLAKIQIKIKNSKMSRLGPSPPFVFFLLLEGGAVSLVKDFKGF